LECGVTHTITTTCGGISLTSFLPLEAQSFLKTLDIGELPISMYASDATARELVASVDGLFGADLLSFPAGGSVPMHTHLGSHILIIVGGEGQLITPDTETHLSPGIVYFVPEGVSHEIVAETALSLISVGDKRRPPSSPDRLAVC
jgi:quercetin dioxygenase-like cupin family protein